MTDRVLFFLKQNFSQGSVLKVMFDWFHSWDPQDRWEEKREWYVFFRIFRDTLLLISLRMPMVSFNLVVTWFFCFDHSKWSSKRTPKCFIVSFCVNGFPTSLNLRRLWVENNQIVFVTLRDNLLALGYWDKFLTSKFIHFTKIFSELLDLSILMSSAKW